MGRVIIKVIALLSVLTYVTCYVASRNNGSDESEFRMTDFQIYWNIPSQRCLRDHNVDINEASLGIITNRHGDGWHGEKITIFYTNLGLHPYIELKTGQHINGGVPQLTDWDRHWRKVEQDINERIPNPDYDGYGVLDYEMWRPLFYRNWGSKMIYRKVSLDLIKAKYPCIRDHEHIRVMAKYEFETAAKKMMLGTLQLAKRLRPKAKWGYYHFTDCFKKKGALMCPSFQKKRNERLDWLLDASDIYFPSGYLSRQMNSTVKALYIQGQLNEMRRMRLEMVKYEHHMSHPKPILMYTRLRYRFDLGWYPKEDLEHTIGQAYAARLDGVVLWENHYTSDTRQHCLETKRYVDDVLGPFLKRMFRGGDRK